MSINRRFDQPSFLRNIHCDSSVHFVFSMAQTAVQKRQHQSERMERTGRFLRRQAGPFTSWFTQIFREI